jgi:hypothetical protein
MTDTDLEQRLHELRVADMAAQRAGQRVDTARAWRELRRLRSRRNRNRRVLAVAVAITAAAAIAIVVPALRSSPSAGSGSRRPSEPATGSTRGPGAVRMYPGAIVARIPLGGVINLVGDSAQAWAIRAREPLGTGNYQLARIDLRTNKVTLRSDLGRRPELIAFSGSALWLTTHFGQAQGQLVRLNPATGKVVATLHLPAGRCTGLAYSGGQLLAYTGGQLWATCEVTGNEHDFFRIDPATGRVDWRAGPAPDQPGPMAATPRSIWYASYASGLRGLIDQGGRARSVTVHDLAFPTSFAYTNELVYGDGAIWAITGDESIARIDPATGRVTRIYTYRMYDPRYNGGLQILTVAQGSLWLSDGLRVLRVSMATGRPLAEVRAGPGVCNQQLCLPLYSTPGAIWMPASTQLIRIDPARMPG